MCFASGAGRPVDIRVVEPSELGDPVVEPTPRPEPEPTPPPVPEPQPPVQEEEPVVVKNETQPDKPDVVEEPVAEREDQPAEPEAPVIAQPDQPDVEKEPVAEQEDQPAEPKAPMVAQPDEQPDADADTSVPISEASAVSGGRVTTLDLGAEIASVEILEKPGIGNLTVNPDNTLALVLTGTDYAGPLSFRYAATFEDGTSQTFDHAVDVQPLTNLKGWSTGESAYMLETDSDGDLVVEYGDTHRVVHVSDSDTALSKSDLAELEGFDAATIHDKTLRNILMEKTEYGATPELPLDQALGKQLWEALNDQPGSHWLLLERGYDYDDVKLFPNETLGESELHPVYVGAYGEGSAPRLVGEQVRLFHGQSNIVAEDLEFATYINVLGAENLIFSDVVVAGHEMNLQGGKDTPLEGITVRNSVLYESTRDTPRNEDWGNTDRIQGIFASKIEGFLLEDIVVDHSGWEADYRYDGDGNFGQAPSKMSHNIYMRDTLTDITMRDSIIMRGASYGVQFRSGGFVEDNAFIDNNAAFFTAGGLGAGHFSLVADNLVTSGAAKESEISAALTWGIGMRDHDTLLDNIVAHLADPNNPDEFASKTGNGRAVDPDIDTYHDDTIVYNWMALNLIGNQRAMELNADRNVDGVDTALADQTTIQNFTAALLGQPTATIDDLGQYLRAQVEDDQLDPVTADEIIAYFQTTFGIAPDVRFAADTLRFVPNDLGDGVRWDNRINWTTEDLPGTVAGDSVDLGGNWVVFATTTARVQDFEFGSDGRLTVTSGKLTIDGETTAGADGADIAVSGAGQLWMNGYSATDPLNIDITGGRFANTGDFSGTADISVTDGQAILATSGAEMRVGESSRLIITGDDAKVGFDGADGDIATLHMEGGRLDFVSDETGFAGITEFRSGHFGDEPDVLSGIDLGDGVLGIDITALDGAALEDTLLGADEILGSFSSIELIGLRGDQDATITFDYETDQVTFNVTAAGEGAGTANVEFLGDMMDADDGEALWAALTDGQGTYSETDPPELSEVEELPELVV
jgi:hypothetical protein